MDRMKMVEYSATALSIIGAVYNIMKSEWGYALWFCSNILWIYFGVKEEHWGFVLTFSVYCIQNMVGFAIWSGMIKI